MAEPKTSASSKFLADHWQLQKYALDKHAIVAITDAKGRIHYVNDLFCEISGYGRDELIGRTHHLVNSGFHSKQFFTDMFQTLRDSGIWRGEICNRRKTGELYWVETTISTLHNEQGELEGYVALRTDVTDQHRTLEAMRRLHEITSDRQADITIKANRILELGCEIFNLPIGIISQVEHNTYTVRYTRNPEDALKPGDSFELGSTFCSETLGCRNAIAHHHVGESDTRNHPAYESFGLESYIGAPLYVKNALFGTINFSGPEPRQRAFGAGEIELIQLFSKWIGDELARSATDAELERQRLLLDAVSEQARIGGWELDLETQELYWSPVTRMIHEVDDDYVPNIDDGISFYRGEEVKEQLRNAINGAIKDGTNWLLEMPLTTARNNDIWVQARGTAVFQGGKCVKLVGSFQDVTDQREQEVKHREEAQRSQLMMESTAVGFWDWNIQTGETSFSERWADIIGYTTRELEPTSIDTWLSACHPDDLKISGERLEEHWEGKTPRYVCEARMKHKDGHWVWIHDTGRVVEWDTKGNPVRMIGTHIDITEQKRAQAEINLNHQRIRLATESAGICIWEYDLASSEMTWDAGMHTLYGISAEKTSPTIAEWERALHEEDHDWVTAKLRESVQRSQPFDHEFRIVRPDGEVRHVRTAATILHDEHEEASRVVGMTSDITQQKESELALLTAKRDAEAAARAKSDFLATMSHEIRTPMNGVLGMLNLLKNTPLTEDQLNRVRIAQNSAQSLLALINDILDFSKIEANKLELESITFDINQTLTESVESLASQAETKGLELVLDTSLLYSPKVVGDPGRVRQIVTNLLSNAIKFTSHGDVTVTIQQVLVKHDWRMMISVSDTGIGISDQKLPNLFNAFSQVDSSTTREFGGSGLGLAIVQNLCERMGGSIEVTSTPGKGSSFTASLMLGQANEVSALPDLKGTNVLLVMKDSKTCQVAARHLTELGAAVTAACSSEEAAEITISSGATYDLMLLDNNIPGEHWRDSAAALSHLPALDTALRLLMVPISFKHGDRYLESGDLHGHILKPLNVLNLVEYARARQQSEQYSVNEQPQSLPSFRGKRVLLVEDNRVNQLVAEEMLTALNIKVVVSENGQEAIETIKNSSSPFDLILMDCQMPVMDGYQATRSIRHGSAGEEHQSTPIIAMTAHAMTGDKERCLASGMNDYLAKPVDPGLLQAMLERWLLSSDAQTLAPEAPRDTRRELELTAVNTIWDRQQALKRVVGNEELLDQLINMFRSEQPLRLAEMTRMYNSGDLNALREAAHNLKGVAGNLGLIAIKKVADRLDQTIRSSAADQCEMLMDELHEETSRLTEFLTNQENDVTSDRLTGLRERLVSISHALEQNDYISQKSLEFMLKPYGNAYLEAELGKLAREITSFENFKAQSRIKSLLQQTTESSENGK